jgi:hypothetical protein
MYIEGVILESTKEYAKSLEKIARDKQMSMISKPDKEKLLKIAALLDKEKKEEVEMDEDIKVECPVCKGEGCDHCDDKGYHMKSEVDETTNSVGGGNVAGLGVGAQGEPGKKKKKKNIKESVQMSKFAGKDVFIVDSDTYHACRLGKKQYARYETYVGKNSIGLAIREYGLKYPKRPIILQNGDTGPMLYLKYGRS